MSDSVQEQLLGHLLGALESDEQADIEEQLSNDPECRKELALLRRQLEPLAKLRQEFTPPLGLAERTCRYVAEQRAVPSPAKGRLRPEFAPPSWISRMSRLDMVMAGTVLVAAGLLIFPALQNSRFNAHRAACANNLGELGKSLNLYSQANKGYFPEVSSNNGNLAVAGIYAPRLAEKGLLTDVSRIICPESSLAARKDEFRVPTYGELQLASTSKVVDLRPTMGGSYGYNLGYSRNGECQPTKNLYRDNFAIMSDAPNMNAVNFQSANHGGRGQNVLFEGGGVQFFTTTKPLGQDDIFTNDNGQVAAGVNPNDSVLGASSTAPIRFVNSQR